MYTYYYSSDLPGWAVALIIGVSLLINIALACWVGRKARAKGYSYGGFWCLSFFLSFIVGIIVVLCIPDRTQGNAYGQPPYGQPPYGQPPYGTQPPYGQASNGQQPPYGQGAYPPQPDPQPGNARSCPMCGKALAADSKFCPECGAKL